MCPRSWSAWCNHCTCSIHATQSLNRVMPRSHLVFSFHGHVPFMASLSCWLENLHRIAFCNLSYTRQLLSVMTFLRLIPSVHIMFVWFLSWTLQFLHRFTHRVDLYVWFRNRIRWLTSPQQDYFVEVDIVMDGSTPLWKAHDISQQLQDKIEDLPNVERAFVHVDHEWTHVPVCRFWDQAWRSFKLQYRNTEKCPDNHCKPYQGLFCCYVCSFFGKNCDGNIASGAHLWVTLQACGAPFHWVVQISQNAHFMIENIQLRLM